MERMTQTTKKNRNCLKIALYQPDIPQNTAAIIRLCACFKTRLDIIEPCGFLLNDKKFKRVSMDYINSCLLYTSPSPRDLSTSRMPSSA